MAHAEALGNAEVQSVIRQGLSSIRACYLELLKQRRLAEGKLLIHFKIGLQGKAMDIQASEDTLGDGDMARCVFATVLKLQFPKPRGNDGVTVSYPFVFRRH